MSFLPASLNPYASTSAATSSSPSSPAYKPASLAYFTIFAPALRPSGAGSEDAAADAAQILFYTSRERAVSQDRMLRQIGIAKGLVEFGAMVTDKSHRSDGDKRQRIASSSKTARCWNIHSSKRRLVLVEVQQGLWIHASIDLPSTARTLTPSANSPADAAAAVSAAASTRPQKESRDYHDAWLSDEWIEEYILCAWRDWRLLNGPLARMLKDDGGRRMLERALERYFSVWTWSWNLESSVQASASEIQELGQSIFTEALGGISMVPSAPRSKLARLMKGFAEKHFDGVAIQTWGGRDEVQQEGTELPTQQQQQRQRELVVLSDTLVLWPPTDAGCFDEDASAGTSEVADAQGSLPCFLDASDRVDILKRVISHLTGLERERALIRAAAAAGVSDSKRKSVTGAVREKSSRSRQSTATALKIRTASSPKTKGRGKADSKRDDENAGSTPSSLHDAGKWSAWGGMCATIGKGLIFKGADTVSASDRSAPSEPASPKQLPVAKDAVALAAGTDKPSTAKAKSRLSSAPVAAATGAENGPSMAGQEASAVDAVKDAAPVSVNETDRSEAKEAFGPFQALHQRLADAMPIQDAGKMWTGAENAWKGLGASLGLGTSASSANDATIEKAQKKGQGGLAADPEDTNLAPHTAAQVNDPIDPWAPAPVSSNHATAVSDAEVSCDRRESLTQSEVDIAELAEALDEGGLSLRPKTATREPSTATVRARDFGTAEASGDADVSFTSIDDVFQPSAAADDDAAAAVGEESDRSVDLTRSSSTSTTESSSKAFPSISVTSAAWYSSKPSKAKVAPAAAKTSTASVETGSRSGPAEAVDRGERPGKTPSVRSEGTEVSLGIAPPSEAPSETWIPAEREKLASIHHDFELDGWGDEVPSPFQSFRCFLKGSDGPLSANLIGSAAIAETEGRKDSVDGVDGVDVDGLVELQVSFTSRRLLTIILIDRLDPSQQRHGSTVSFSSSSSSRSGLTGHLDVDSLLSPAWEVLRRAQRMLNDHERAQKAKVSGEDERPSRFLHLDGPTLTLHNRLHDETAQKLEEGSEACALGHCLAAKSVIERHGVRETFARSNNGKTWVASRVGQAASSSTATSTLQARGEMTASSASGSWNATYMLIGGRSVSIVDCDNELRRVANEFPSFGI